MKNIFIINLLFVGFSFSQVSDYGLSLYANSHAGILTKKGESSFGVFLTGAQNIEDQDAQKIMGLDLSYLLAGGVELQAGVASQSSDENSSNDLETTSLSIKVHIKGPANFTFGATQYVHNFNNQEFNQIGIGVGWYTNSGLLFEFAHINVEDDEFEYGDYEKITLAQYIRTKSGFCFGIGYSAPVDLFNEGNLSVSIGSIF
jgi:hypothetical protein